MGVCFILLVFNVTMWFGQSTLIKINKLSTVVKTAVNIFGLLVKTFTDIYRSAVYKKAQTVSQTIIKNDTHCMVFTKLTTFNW